MMRYLPAKLRSVTVLPSWSVSANGPPILAPASGGGRGGRGRTAGQRQRQNDHRSGEIHRSASLDPFRGGYASSPHRSKVSDHGHLRFSASRSPARCSPRALPAAAQLKGSPGYQFLDAVRDDKGDEVDKILAKPGTRIIDTQDRDHGRDRAAHRRQAQRFETTSPICSRRGADPNIKDNSGNTPLLVAIDRGFAGLVPILLKGKANPNFVGDGGQTPLIKAVLRRDEEMVRALLDGGADPDRKDYLAGKSARDYANEDTRNATLAKLFADVPVKTRARCRGRRCSRLGSRRRAAS